MPRIHLVRHAHPAAGWGEDADPGLDVAGRRQAEAAALRLARTLDRLPIYTSPLRRCRETADPLERLWRQSARILEPVSELPSPPLDLPARHRWLMEAMGGTWLELSRLAPAGSPDYQGWRRTLLASLAALPHECVVFTHFVAINAVVAAARSREEVVCFRPAHASITCVDVDGGVLRLVELGREADPSVLPGS